MQVSDLMTRDVRVANAGETIREAARLMESLDAGVLPVGEQGRLVGMITDRDIAVRAVAGGKDIERASAGDYMTTPVRSVPMDTSLADVCAAMESAQVRRLPVVEASGRLCGVVAQADIALNGGGQRTAEVVREVSKPC